MIGTKIKQIFPDIAIMKNADKDSIFTGRNLPSFVKDFIILRYLNSEGKIDQQGVTEFLDKYIPDKKNPTINRLMNNEIVQLLTCFIVQSDIQGGKVRFAIDDTSIKASNAIIPEKLLSKYKKELIDGKTWGLIKLVYIRPFGKEKGHIEMVDFKPFRPYSVDLEYFKKCRKQFTTEEWIDVLISAMEYSPDGFADTQKLEFLARLLIFVEPNLNMIELAPKETGKSYVFGNLSKFGWLVSGGKISRAKLFYDKSRKIPGLFYNHDFLAFDEIQTISLTDESELQGIFKAYLEQGKATVDNYEFLSSAGLMLMGNIQLTSEMLPANDKYFTELPATFRDSALLDRFHGFIEGWKLPKLRKDMFLKGWTLNVEYFSEILHLLRTSAEYSSLFDVVVYVDEKSGARDSKAVKKLATAYTKLLFPHITKAEELSKDEFLKYCLEPAIRRRGIIREQCYKTDAEFKAEMPEIKMKNIFEFKKKANSNNNSNDVSFDINNKKDRVEIPLNKILKPVVHQNKLPLSPKIIFKKPDFRITPDESLSKDDFSDNYMLKFIRVCDYYSDEIRNNALKIVALSAGEFNLSQICDIFDFCNTNWTYVNDPQTDDCFLKASDILNNGLNGDCDEYAILTCSLILAIGGEARIVIAYNDDADEAHAFTEVNIGTTSIEDVREYLSARYSNFELWEHKGNDGNFWLNMDWQVDYPGGKYWKYNRRKAYNIICQSYSDL